VLAQLPFTVGDSMVATLYLLGCILLPGQISTRPQPPARVASSPGSDWLLVPHLNRSQELVYRGVFSEDGRGSGVQFSRSYRLETRIFILDTPPRGAEMALLTVLKHRPSTGGPTINNDVTPSSVCLERVHVDLQGKCSADPGVRLTVPLDGPPALECGAFVALPGGRVRVGQEWAVIEPDRPPLVWRATGMEMIGGNNCIKLVGEQKSNDWERPRADRAAWHRRETVWIAPRLGLAQRVEREIQSRDPGSKEATRQSRLRLELESSFQLSGQASEGRKQEIAQALAFREALTPLLAQPARHVPHLTALVKKIDHYCERPDTPYRAAILQIKRRAEAARRGETPPEPIREAKSAPTVVALGEVAPDFIASNLTGGGSAHLRQWKGKPILLVFYHPSSGTTPAVLRYAQQVSTRYAGRVHVIGMSVSDNADLIRKQHADMRLAFPILSAGGLRKTFDVETTPKMMLLDSSNVVRGGHLGWGDETPTEVLEDLKHWLPPGINLPPTPQPRR
jgi:peroxiredoxin